MLSHGAVLMGHDISRALRLSMFRREGAAPPRKIVLSAAIEAASAAHTSLLRPRRRTCRSSAMRLHEACIITMCCGETFTKFFVITPSAKGWREPRPSSGVSIGGGEF